MAERIDPIFSSRLLLQACIGVFAGVLLALLIAGICWPVGGRLTVAPEGLLAFNLKIILFKPREKSFFLLALLLGTITAYFSTAKLYKIRPIFLFLGLMISIPLTNFLARQILQNNHSFLLLLLLLGMMGLFLLSVKRSAWQMKPLAILPSNNQAFSWKYYSIGLFIMFLLLCPASISQVGANISVKVEREVHIVSFMVGPALYFLGNHLLPGIDYFTQYSLGMGWIFFYLLGQTAEQTILHYVLFILISIWLFYAQMLYLLQWLYRSWTPALIVTLLSLILLFHTKEHFFDPSSSILRYPFMGVCAWALAKWLESGNFQRLLVLSATLALSLFFNTETGIIFSVATVLSCLFTTRHIFSIIIPIINLGFLTLSFLLMLMVLVFGYTILQPAFFWSLIEPLLLFGKVGYGGWAIYWALNNLNWFNNLVAPAVAMATLALIARRMQATDADKPRMAVLAFISVSGLLMLAKYVNMSIMGIWQVNALGLLVPFAWWSMVILRRLQSINFKISVRQHKIPGFTIGSVVLAIGLIWMGGFTQDLRNPSEYGFHSWLHYPALITAPFRKHKVTAGSEIISDKDVALIKERTHPGEQVAVIDIYDWAYLIHAHRPPLMLFLPSPLLFTEHQFRESLNRLKNANYLFLSKGQNKEAVISQAEIKEVLMPTFYKTYAWDGEGDRLVAWRRKNFSKQNKL